jgi:hypothetical protein
MSDEKFPRHSSMEFIPDNAYPIEESRAYTRIGGGIRSVEFIRLKGAALLFIEAKTTFANPNDSPEPFAKSICEMCEKFVHSLNLFSAVKIGVVRDVLPEAFDNMSETNLTFVLVVRDHKQEWCRPIKRAIEQALPSYLIKIWRNPTVLVINHDTAINQGIVVARDGSFVNAANTPPLKPQR